MDPHEGRGGAGDEDAGLVDGAVDGVELPVLGEGGGAAQGEEEGGGYALVDGVFGYVDQEEGEHAVGWLVRRVTGVGRVEVAEAGGKDVLGEEEGAHLAEVSKESCCPGGRGAGLDGWF